MAVAIVGVLSFAVPADAATVRLFRDIFAGSNTTDLNANQSGQSGTESTINWIESSNGRLANGDAVLDSSGRLELRKPSGDANGNNGAMIYLDNNFSGLKSFDVSVRLLNGSSGGNGRFSGFSIGQSKAELDAQTGASPGRAPGDFSIFYDSIGGTRGIQIRHNGSNQGYIPGTSNINYPDTLKVEFEFDDMNAGTQLDYEVFLASGAGSPPFSSIGSGSTTWSGTGENYISLQSNYTSFSRYQFIEINGEVIPEPGSLALLGLSGGLLLFRRRR